MFLPAPKRVLCIMDLSVVGRASLSATLPVLAACGVQGCGLPAALYSTHTGGFSSLAIEDVSAFGEQALRQYRQEEIAFDGILIGYLSSREQLSLAEHALQSYPRAFKIVDPALGDGGKLYSGLGPEIVEGMSRLCKFADLITPNETELELLTGAKEQAKGLKAMMKVMAGPKTSVLVTSVPNEWGGGMAGCSPEGADEFRIGVHRYPQSYPGTGDLFTGALAGLLMRGLSLQESARAAGAFVGEAVRITLEGGGEPRQGVWFEECLPMLHQMVGQRKLQ